jgi:hypothetical protein
MSNSDAVDTLLRDTENLFSDSPRRTVNDEVIESVISTQSERYGKEAPLVMTRGKVHDCLGMTLDFSVEGKVS